jgi:hypothetical protein
MVLFRAPTAIRLSLHLISRPLPLLANPGESQTFLPR